MDQQQKQGSDHSVDVKHIVKIAVALYVVYVVYHFVMGANYGCDFRMSLLFLFPVKQMYTIPMIDKAVHAGFGVDNNPNNLDSAQKLTVGIGMAGGALVKGFMSIEHCAAWRALGGDIGPVFIRCACFQAHSQAHR